MKNYLVCGKNNLIAVYLNILMKKNIYLLFSSLCIFTQCTPVSNKNQALKGVLDLRTYDFTQNGIFDLSGQWEFYWQKFYFSDNILLDSNKKYINVPGSWNKFLIQNEPVGGIGYATYRLKLLLSTKTSRLTLKIPIVNNAYKIFINGQLRGKGGEIGRNKQTTIPGYNPIVIPIANNLNELEIILQIANYHHRSGGLRRNLTLGLESQIRRSNNHSKFSRFALVGSILIMAFYHLGLFWIRKKNVSTLYFGLFCLIAVLRILLEGEALIYHLFPIDWFTNIRLEYLSMPLAILAFTWFLHSLFYDDFSRKEAISWSIPLISLALLILCFSPFIFSRTLIIIQSALIISCLYALMVLAKAVSHQREGARLLLTGFIVLFISLIHDILHNRGIIQSTHYFAIGLFIFILAQAQVLSLRFSKAFTQIENLTQQLDEVNKNLEQTIEIRTHSLQVINEQLARENKKNTDSLRAAEIIQTTVLPAEQKMQELFTNGYFIIYKPKDIVSGDFYWINKVENQPQETYLIAVVDCVGHGVPGALMSMMGNSFLNDIINQQKIYNTQQILYELNKKIQITLKHNQSSSSRAQGMDVCLCKLENISDEFTKVSFTGSKRPLFYTEDRNLKEIKGDRISIGSDLQGNQKGFTTQDIILQNGNMLYLTTDGFSSISNSNRKSFGTRRLKNMLANHSHLHPQEQKQVFENILMQYQQKTDQRDDITIVGIML